MPALVQDFHLAMVAGRRLRRAWTLQLIYRPDYLSLRETIAEYCGDAARCDLPAPTW